MCIGLPMQVLATRPGRATVQGQGTRREIDTALVGEVVPGEWLLVFLDAARERLSPQRAAEVAATLALVHGAMDALEGLDHAPAPADPGFALPSAMSAAQLAALTGGRG